jgi:hypothetical protein
MPKSRLPAALLILAVAAPGAAAASFEEAARLHPPAVVPVVGLKLTAPQLLSLLLGVVWRRSWEPRPGEYAHAGPLLLVEPGLYGHKAHLGWALVSPNPGLPEVDSVPGSGVNQVAGRSGHRGSPISCRSPNQAAKGEHHDGRRQHGTDRAG